MAAQNPYLKIIAGNFKAKPVNLSDSMVMDYGNEVQKSIVKSITPQGTVKNTIICDLDGTEDPRIEITDVVIDSSLREFLKQIVNMDIQIRYFVQGLTQEEKYTCVLKQVPPQGSKELKQTLIFLKI